MTYGNKPYELQDDNGNLFLNKKKNDNSPDWSGKMKLNGQVFYMSAWAKKTKAGDTYYSGRWGKIVPANTTSHARDKDKIGRVSCRERV